MNKDNKVILKLADFGCAKTGKFASNANTSTITKSKNTIKGTESYMAFEVLQNKFYFESDLFSLGLVLL